MAGILQTARLTLEPWDEEATDLLGRLARIPAVVRHIADGTTWSDARIAATAAAAQEHWRAHGFGWRLAREAGSPVGFIALSFAGRDSGVDAHEYEIGWWLAPPAWGRGLAREGAAAVRDEAFERLAAPSIVARVQPVNAASLRVAEAIGCSWERRIRGRVGEAVEVLRLSRADWRELPRPARRDGPA